MECELEYVNPLCAHRIPRMHAPGLFTETNTLNLYFGLGDIE